MAHEPPYHASPEVAPSNNKSEEPDKRREQQEALYASERKYRLPKHLDVRGEADYQGPVDGSNLPGANKKKIFGVDLRRFWISR